MGGASETKAKPAWRQYPWAKGSDKQHGLITWLPGKHTTPKEDDLEYLLRSPNSEYAPPSCLKTYSEEYKLVVHTGLDITMHRVSLWMRVKELLLDGTFGVRNSNS